MSGGITIEAVTLRYGDTLALDDVSLEIPAGAVTGLIGANGSGKSSLLNAIVGRVRPTRGRVRLAGSTSSSARRGQLLGYVPQAELIDRRFPVSVREVTMMGRYGRQGFTRRVRSADADAVDAALAKVHLSELAGRQIGSLSGGQLKRTFVARCLAQDAEYLLLDEPFAGVDAASQAMIVSVLRRLASEGRTVFVSSHDLGALPELADEAVLLQQRVVYHGPVEQALRPERIAAAFGLGAGEGA